VFALEFGEPIRTNGNSNSSSNSAPNSAIRILHLSWTGRALNICGHKEGRGGVALEHSWSNGNSGYFPICG
jgi:hypothetical protein